MTNLYDENCNFARISYEFATFFRPYVFYDILLYRKTCRSCSEKETENEKKADKQNFGGHNAVGNFSMIWADSSKDEEEVAEYSSNDDNDKVGAILYMLH